MSNVQSAAGWARDTTLWWLILLVLHGEGARRVRGQPEWWVVRRTANVSPENSQGGQRRGYEGLS